MDASRLMAIFDQSEQEPPSALSSPYVLMRSLPGLLIHLVLLLLADMDQAFICFSSASHSSNENCPVIGAVKISLFAQTELLIQALPGTFFLGEILDVLRAGWGNASANDFRHGSEFSPMVGCRFSDLYGKNVGVLQHSRRYGFPIFLDGSLLHSVTASSPSLELVNSTSGLAGCLWPRVAGAL